MAKKTTDHLDIKIWDVEHGSAAYVRAGQKDVVIDCGANTGENEFSPLRWITGDRVGVQSIDYLIISHPHHDHIEDLDVMDELDIAPRIFQRPKNASELVSETLEDAREKDDTEYIEDAEYYLSVLDEYDGELDVPPSNPSWAIDEGELNNIRADGGSSAIPDDGVTFHNYGTKDSGLGNERFHQLNNLSKITVINSFGFQFVTMGDLMPKGIERMKQKEAVMDAIKDSEVLVAPHHGRDSSYDKGFVEHINPDLVVCSDKGDPQNPATSDYREHATGVSITHENTGEEAERSVLTTRNDGRVRIQASTADTWEVSVYGRNYSDNKADSRRYQSLV